MENILLPINKNLNGNEEEFRSRFIELLARRILILQNEEKFCQCLNTDGGYLYYNPAWFVSNYGYIISVARGTFYELKPSLKTGGFERHGETRWTDYLRATYPNWENNQEKGWEPQYYFYGNSYPYSHGMSDIKVLHPVVQKIVAFYFLCDDERMKVLDPLYEVHHIKPFDWNRSSKYNNRADNLQVLLEMPNVNEKEHPEQRQHTFTHNVDRATSQTNIENLVQRSLSSEIPHIFLQPDELEKFVLAGLKKTPGVAVGLSVKNEDGSPYMNAYYSGSDVKPIKE